ncbi:MAG: PilZ domain-containing protein [Candidatus Aminicenantes bacterium]|nr:PilZ domain-containing protein [Candidatus Aminicenantes bacterium]
MTKKKKPKKQKDIHDQLLNRRREWRLDMPLKAEIKGKLPNGENFSETTTIDNISSGGAYFGLNARITIDTKLNLTIDIPSKLTDGKKTKLSLSGSTVRMEKTDSKKKKLNIAVHFNKKYKFLD